MRHRFKQPENGKEGLLEERSEKRAERRERRCRADGTFDTRHVRHAKSTITRRQEKEKERERRSGTLSCLRSRNEVGKVDDRVVKFSPFEARFRHFSSRELHMTREIVHESAVARPSLQFETTSSRGNENWSCREFPQSENRRRVYLRDQGSSH
jgi:hypothetical protein